LFVYPHYRFQSIFCWPPRNTQSCRPYIRLVPPPSSLSRSRGRRERPPELPRPVINHVCRVESVKAELREAMSRTSGPAWGWVRKQVGPPISQATETHLTKMSSEFRIVQTVHPSTSPRGRQRHIPEDLATALDARDIGLRTSCTTKSILNPFGTSSGSFRCCIWLPRRTGSSVQRTTSLMHPNWLHKA